VHWHFYCGVFLSDRCHKKNGKKNMMPVLRPVACVGAGAHVILGL